MVAFMTLSITSCSDTVDGDWPPMEWQQESFMGGNYIFIPAQGGTFTLTCKNYNPWISHIKIDGKYVSPRYDDNVESIHNMTASWITVNIVENKVTLTIPPIDKEQIDYRDATLDLTAGDIFHSFHITQE